jgi:serine/threonine protein kinase
MTADRFRQVRSLFEAALDRTPESCAAFLADACAGDQRLRAEVEQLLSAHAAHGPLDIPLIARQMDVEYPPSEGKRIGPYECLRELGRGGMGVVYLCRRTDGADPRLIALKLLRSDYLSKDLLHRFDQERRILASLDHPNIARLLDGGRTSDGLPFYVMEFIDGKPIDEYCDQNSLDIPARLALFQQVCSAVECAHGAGIVHRDIKPSNILVTSDGMVKLLDFGIAKQLQIGVESTTLWLTQAGLRPMTPEYASPEQIQSAEVTRATDVYSLGVVLYEILTGHRPYRLENRVFHEVLRIVCEEDPILPSVAINLPSDAPGVRRNTDPATIAALRRSTVGELQKQLSGDVDMILTKALRKEARQRYSSASHLNEEIRRYLAGLPVEARSGRYYQLSKRLNRHRGWLMAALFLVAAILTGGIHVTWPTLWTGIAVAALFAMWHVWTDREAARKIAASPAWPTLRMLVITAFFVSVIGVDAVFGFIAGFQKVPHWKFNSDPFWPLRAFWCIPLGLLLARWLVRARWGGNLILNASTRRNRWCGFMAIISTAYLAGKVVWGVAIGTLPQNPAAGIFFMTIDALLWVALFVLSGRVELRQSGIVTAVGFYSWQNIERFRWIEELPEFGILDLHLRHRHLFPSTRLRVPKSKTAEVEAVMDRFLSEWPGGAN